MEQQSPNEQTENNVQTKKETQSKKDHDMHLKFAKDLFNLTWDLIEKAERTEQETDTMIHAAHASRYHWGIVGTPLHFARGEWQISRVYSLVGRTEPAYNHAEKSLKLCEKNNLGDFDLGFAYEALARAYAVQGDLVERDRNIGLAIQAAERVTKEENKNWLLKNVHTVASLSLPVWE